jgi:hypothetical protein
MVRTRWFQQHPGFARATLGFVVIAAILYLLLGPAGLLLALGFEVLYLLTIAFAALLDPDVY